MDDPRLLKVRAERNLIVPLTWSTGGDIRSESNEVSTAYNIHGRN